MRTVTDYKQLNIKNIVSNIHSVKDYVRFNGHKVTLMTTSPNYGGVVYVIGLYALSAVNVKTPYMMLSQ
ncbi:hypothetical protein [Leuconostoc suionicum]|uniref:hypothetical protein n=1 Tax=Leuconostoc suionicum TaxID=1511761 RepID=UPI0024ADA7EA|nr:hypothetical protein [Leuconostoc suionicum]MDI6681453.1 hypothetical protein [Leuconostoc suionicum]